MNEEDVKMYHMLQEFIKSGIDKDSALDFFARLTPNDYGRMIEVIENTDIADVKDETREKVLTILHRLKNEELR